MLISANIFFKRRFSSSNAFIWLIMDASVTRQGFALQKPERACRHTSPATYKRTRSLSAFAAQKPAGQRHHPVLAAKLRHSHAPFGLAQNRQDLRVAVSACLHRNLLMRIAEKILLMNPVNRGGDYREPVEQRGGHLGIAEDGGPFATGKARGHDDRSALVELADEIEQQLPAGLGMGR